MQDYKHNNSATQYVKKRNRQIVMIIGVVIIIVITSISTARLLKSRSVVHTIKTDLEREKAELLETQRKLDASLHSFSDEAGIDRVIRNTYRAVKEGEEMVVLVPDKS